MVNVVIDDLFVAFDNFVTFFPTSERKLLPVANPFDTYDEMTFRERYRLSKSVMKCLMRGGDWAGCGPAQSPPRCTKCNSPPIIGQCTTFILFDVAL